MTILLIFLKLKQKTTREFLGISRVLPDTIEAPRVNE